MMVSCLNVHFSVSQVGTGNQVLGDHRQRTEPNERTEFIAERERTDLFSDSTLHRTWEQANSKQRLTLGAGGILFL